jgi:amino acid transporter
MGSLGLGAIRTVSPLSSTTFFTFIPLGAGFFAVGVVVVVWVVVVVPQADNMRHEMRRVLRTIFFSLKIIDLK